jgi:biopolymer transport protein ExbD
MPKVKIPKKSIAVDMTAMCDVSFLLLTFFILTAKFRPSEAILIDSPTSRAEVKVPDDILTITVDEEGKAYIGFSVPKRRAAVLNTMIERYGSKYPVLNILTEAQKQNFVNLELLGNSVAELPDVLSRDPSEFSNAKLFTGVPKDSADNQLGDWINAARAAAMNESYDLPIAIKGDQVANVMAVKDIIETLREREIFRFHLITSQEGKID